jgi:hypothetical protein
VDFIRSEFLHDHIAIGDPELEIQNYPAGEKGNTGLLLDVVNGSDIFSAHLS